MPVLQSRELQRMVGDPNAYATTLLVSLLDKHGNEALTWSPQTIEMELQSDHGVDISDNALERLVALITAVTTDVFHNDVSAFARICTSLSGDPADFYTVDSVDPEAMAWAVMEVAMLVGNQTYSSDVKRFIGVCLEDHGLLQPPKILTMADYRPGVLAAAESSAAQDAEGYTAWFTRNRDDAKAVDDWLAGRVRELFRQLNALPLQHRDPESWGSIASKYLGVVNSSQG